MELKTYTQPTQKQPDFQKVAKDMSVDYSEKLAKIISEVDEIKKECPFNVMYYYSLKERMTAWYVKLAPKLTDEEIAAFKQLRDEINNNVFHKNDVFYKSNQKIHINTTNLIKYKNDCEEMEILLNKFMERLGLTNVTKDYRRLH